MNYRIRKNGGKIYMATDINLSYYCRDTVKGITGMADKNGTWNIITMKLCPGSMGLRHFIPLLFTLSVIGLVILSLIHYFFLACLGLELLLYFGLDLYFSIKCCASFKELLILFVLFPIFHVSYGWGSIKGIFKLCTKKYRKNNYTPKSI